MQTKNGNTVIRRKEREPTDYDPRLASAAQALLEALRAGDDDRIARARRAVQDALDAGHY
jgi:hypothetical protein